MEIDVKRGKNASNLTVRLLTVEAKSKEGQEETVAFKAVERRCFKSNLLGRLTKSSKRETNEERIIEKEVKCFICSKVRHTAKDCESKRDE